MFTPLSLPADHFGLYIHIPFCVRKCRYCDFASQSFDPTMADRYLDALAAEAEQRRDEINHPLRSIYIGGGTPTVLGAHQLRRLWKEILTPFCCQPGMEFTIEANPGTLTDDILAVLADMPLTRISLGVQSFHPEELAMLGRIHTPDDVYEAVRKLRPAGPWQLNLDLIYGLPGQTAAAWQANLQQALALQPDHLSLYSLMLEEGTPLAADFAAGYLTLPGEEEEEEMAIHTAAMLADAGLRLYEVSNAARPGAHSRHNLGYWLGRDYLGLGLAATSTIEHVRWRNTGDLAAYYQGAVSHKPVIDYAERLSAASRLLERVMLGLRLRDGFDLAAAEAACGVTLDEVAGVALAEMIESGLIERCSSSLRLTSAGFSLANTVVARLMDR